MPQSTPTSSNTSARKRLGRGLSSLLSTPVKVNVPDKTPAQSSVTTMDRPMKVQNGTGESGDATSEYQMIETAAIEPSQFQPRRMFDQSALEGLASSIREAGMMQPLVVRPGQREGMYELIAGERRWRAAQMLGLEQVPAIVRDVDGQTAAQWALIENLQREDLNAIERAEAFRRLAE